jgi:uncharacterized membrane protein
MERKTLAWLCVAIVIISVGLWTTVLVSIIT